MQVTGSLLPGGNSVRNSSRPNRLARLAVLALVAGAASATLSGQARAEYPDHAITAIVPFAPGGSNDLVARVVSPYLSKLLGQPVVVVNKPGAAGNVGISFTTQAKPDGYTFVFAATAATQNPALFKHLPYDPITDVVPVAQLAEGPYIFVTKKDLPVKNLQEFIELVRKNPGKLNGSAGGIGTRLSIELFNLQNNLKTVVIAYDGTGPAATALYTGEADFAITDPASLVGAVNSGTVRGLAVAGEKHLSELPGLPTTKEAGLPAYQASAPYGVYVAKGTPADIVKKLHDSLNEVTKMPEVVERLNQLGLSTVEKTQEAFKAYYLAEIDKWKKVAETAKIPAQDD